MKNELKKALYTRFNNDSYCEPYVKRPERTSNDLKITQPKTKSNKINKNVPKVGSMQENIEINEHYSKKILHNNNI